MLNQLKNQKIWNLKYNNSSIS